MRLTVFSDIQHIRLKRNFTALSARGFQQFIYSKKRFSFYVYSKKEVLIRFAAAIEKSHFKCDIKLKKLVGFLQRL